MAEAARPDLGAVDAADAADAIDDDDGGSWGRRLEIALTLILAFSAITTAWSGYQASQWGGEQSAATARAAALRYEADQAASSADAVRSIDVAAFLSWVSAMAQEAEAYPPLATMTEYEPAAGTESAFLYHRFRPEFLPAFDAWMATGPLANPDAPATPFEMPQYVLNARILAEDLAAQSQAAGREAATASDNNGKWVLMGVMFALVLFFASISSKAHGRRKLLLSGCAVVAFVVSLAVLLSHPVLWP